MAELNRKNIHDYCRILFYNAISNKRRIQNKLGLVVFR